MIGLILLWIIYYFLHSTLASLKVKDWAEKRMGRFYRYYRLAYNAFSLLGFAGIAAFQFSLPNDSLIPHNPLLLYAGIVLIIGGVAIGYIAFSQYDSREFIGLTTPDDQPRKLVVSGLNRYVRHPLYFATILLLVGVLLASFTPNTATFVAISLAYLVIGTLLEEKKLEKTFGEEYRTYKNKVKMFIPFIV